MGVVSDVLDAVVELSTGSADFVTEKYQTAALVIVAALVLVFLLILFVYAPTYGLAALVAIVLIVYLLQQGDALA